MSRSMTTSLLLTALAAGEAAASTHRRSLYGESTANHTWQLSVFALSQTSPPLSVRLNYHTDTPADPVLSCSSGAQPNLTDTCCTETYGGLLLSTQFWNTYTGYESEGQILPKDSWTLHGLWPDFCDGSYTQYCDPSRQYDPAPSGNTSYVAPYNGSNIGTFLAPFGKADLLSYMNKFWVSQGQPSPDFWGHEFSKHATCYSTFDVACYGPQYVPHEDVVDFFETAIAWYRTLPTHAWLAAAGIVPSNSTTYSLGDIQAVLAAAFGAVPYLACSGAKSEDGSGYTALSEVWYYHHAVGRPQDRIKVPVAANATGGSLGNCATSPGAIHYYLRANGSEA